MDAIAVIGGGVAGLTAVRALQRAGHAPMLIAPAVARSGNRGELLGSGALAPLTTLDWRHLLDDELVAMPAVARFSAWGSPALVRHAVDAGWHVDRTHLESAMRANVAAETLRARTGAVRDVAREGDGWRLLLSTGEEVRARFVVDCSGRAATMARRLGGHRRRDSRLVAMHRTLSLPGTSVMAASLVESAPDGWWYTSPLPDQGKLFAAFFTDADLLQDRNSRQCEPWAGNLAAAPKTRARLESLGGTWPESPSKVVVASTASQERVSGDGWAAAGDAAVALDPLAGHGLTVALWSAIQAAAAADAWLEGDDGPLQTYQEAVAAGMSRFIADADRHYRAERRFHGREFWTRRHQRAAPADLSTARSAPRTSARTPTG